MKLCDPQTSLKKESESQVENTTLKQAMLVAVPFFFNFSCITLNLGSRVTHPEDNNVVALRRFFCNNCNGAKKKKTLLGQFVSQRNSHNL